MFVILFIYMLDVIYTSKVKIFEFREVKYLVVYIALDI